MLDKKFVATYKIDGYEIETDTGWADVVALHKTVPYKKYEVVTESGKKLSCADRHIVFDEDMHETYVKDLPSKVMTCDGVEDAFVIIYDEEEHMYDFELAQKSNHRYYTSGILSHNTMIARTIAKMLNVPFAIADSTVLTESGYVGEDVESVLVRLYQAADYDVEKTERGIVFIDEIDKIARKSDNPSITRDVSGEGVQQGLLKLLEDSIVNIPPKGGRKHPEQPMVQINTKNILFICGGAFNGIEKKIKQRTNKRSIGFDASHAKEEDKDVMKKLTAQDLKAFGLIPELLGRLPVITYTDELDRDALYDILTKPKNALYKQYQKIFKLDGIDLHITKAALEYIVDKTIDNKLGARGLRGVMEDVMTDAMFNMPSTNKKKLTIDVNYVKKQLEDKN